MLKRYNKTPYYYIYPIFYLSGPLNLKACPYNITYNYSDGSHLLSQCLMLSRHSVCGKRTIKCMSKYSN